MRKHVRSTAKRWSRYCVDLVKLVEITISVALRPRSEGVLLGVTDCLYWGSVGLPCAGKAVRSTKKKGARLTIDIEHHSHPFFSIPVL